MTPLEQYNLLITSGDLKPDAAQSRIINKLNNIYLSIEKEQHRKKTLRGRLTGARATRGLYLWGGVGIGKTRMMDIFFNCLSTGKLRMHFHQFMHKTHQALTEIQGHKNPLTTIAKQIASKTSVICFDEFFVTNITDAMLLGELFTELFRQGITLIASSNIAPDLLYKDGLQRERFLPAIAEIKKHCETLYVPTTVDYRQQQIKQAGVFYSPLNDATKQLLENCFIHFSHGAQSDSQPLSINERSIPIIKKAGRVAWFDFDVLCGKPRCQLDYLALTKEFHTILISGLHAIPASDKNTITLFIYLIDILYDAHCRLVISSSVSIDAIYLSGELLAPFNRTHSRLIEMQSEAYLDHEKTSDVLTPL